jgi:sodium-dependent dicarboxylate transporter 2/3/5
MALWWITDVIPVYVTAMLPLALFPLLGTATIEVAAGAYGDPLIFLFFGGFIVALALERWGLHRRVALTVLQFVGSRPDYIVGAFMGITAFISLWVTNTATTLMMLPVALSVVDTLAASNPADPRTPKIGTALMLGVAYAASIGGMGTMIGTAPNVFVASFINSQLHREISFLDWMIVAMPLVVLLLLAAWWLLTRVVFRLGQDPLPGTRQVLQGLTGELGPVTRAERLTAIVFLTTAAAWVFRALLADVTIAGIRPFSGLTDAGIAISAAILLFVLPAGPAAAASGGGRFLMDWPTATRVPWGLLLLFGGGLSLAASFEETGLADYLAAQGQGLERLPTWILVAAIATVVVFLSEIASNVATATTVVPVLAALAIGAGLEPVPLVLAACFAASCGFMLPVATPPNAIAYGTGRVTAGQMAQVGFLLNILGILFITAVTCGIIIPFIGAK